jgi:hypothetical protein
VDTAPDPDKPPQTIIFVPVHNAIWRLRADGVEGTIDVRSHVSVLGEYRPPVRIGFAPSFPPQTMNSVPVQTPVWR